MVERNADEEVSETNATVDDLPNEVLFNILERFQDDKPLLNKCLTVSKRWYDIALPQLWYHFEFGIYHESQTRMLNRLMSIRDKCPNFSLIRSLTLYVHLRGRIVRSIGRCQEITEIITKYVDLLRICPGVRSLRIALHPFVESDAHPSVWETLQTSNITTMLLVQTITQREYSELFFDISQEKFHYEEGLWDIYQHYIDIIGGQVTKLHLCESAAEMWPWFNTFRRLRTLNLDNTGNPGEKTLSKFWDAISKFPLEELTLSGITFPRQRKFKKWQNSLRMINLNRFNDIEGACSTILQSFPNLHSLRLHNSNSLANTNTSIPIEEIVCNNLRIVVFTRCRPQENIISQIAEACPLLQVCMPPNNASDSDIIKLIDSCQFLTNLSINYCTNLTSASIHYIPRAERLRSLLFNIEHFVVLDEACIRALAENCPDLHSRRCRFSTMGEKNERLQRIAVREKLSGTARYKRWLLRFIAWAQDGPHFQNVTVDIDSIRRETDEVGL